MIANKTRCGPPGMVILGGLALATCAPTAPAPASPTPQPTEVESVTTGVVATLTVDPQGQQTTADVAVPLVLVVPAQASVKEVLAFTSQNLGGQIQKPTLVYKLQLVASCTGDLDCKPCTVANGAVQPDCGNFPPPPPTPKIDGLIQDGFVFVRTIPLP